MSAQDERRWRASARASWPGQVVPASQPKPALYHGTTVAERFGLMTRLCRAQWLASHGELIERPRSQWPGEVFEIRRDSARASG